MPLLSVFGIRSWATAFVTPWSYEGTWPKLDGCNVLPLNSSLLARVGSGHSSLCAKLTRTLVTHWTYVVAERLRLPPVACQGPKTPHQQRNAIASISGYLQRLVDAVFAGRCLLNAARVYMNSDWDPKRVSINCWLKSIRESSQLAADPIMTDINSNRYLQGVLGRSISLDDGNMSVTPMTMRDTRREMHELGAHRSVAEESPRPTRGDGVQSLASHPGAHSHHSDGRKSDEPWNGVSHNVWNRWEAHGRYNVYDCPGTCRHKHSSRVRSGNWWTHTWWDQYGEGWNDQPLFEWGQYRSR